MTLIEKRAEAQAAYETHLAANPNDTAGLVVLYGRIERTQGQIDYEQKAKHLEAIWIERETKQRQVAQDAAEQNEPSRYGHYAAMAGSTKQFRLDLQYEFRLTQRLGAGPMTRAEAEEYIDNELKEQP